MPRRICRCGCGFRAIYHLTQTKQGISSIELARRLEKWSLMGSTWKLDYTLTGTLIGSSYTIPGFGTVTNDGLRGHCQVIRGWRWDEDRSRLTA